MTNGKQTCNICHSHYELLNWFVIGGCRADGTTEKYDNMCPLSDRYDRESKNLRVLERHITS